jgi:hypothetical protein
MTWKPSNTYGDLPDFDEGGNLPAGDYTPSAQNLKAYFVDRFTSETRSSIFQGWLKLKEAAIRAGVSGSSDVLFNGSFTTSKPNPRDIDLAVGIETDCHTSDLFRSASTLFRGNGSIDEYGCDAYCFPLLPGDHPHHASLTIHFKDYWLKWFGTDRSMRPKGRVWTTLSEEE